MTVKLASESFQNISRQMSRRTDPATGYFGFLPSDTWTPSVNLYESEADYLVCFDLAGVDKAEIDLVVHEGRLKLKGKRAVPIKEAAAGPAAAATPARRVRVHLMEIDHGNFSREVELPADVNNESIAASFENGLLWVQLPKR